MKVYLEIHTFGVIEKIDAVVNEKMFLSDLLAELYARNLIKVSDLNSDDYKFFLNGILYKGELIGDGDKVLALKLLYGG